MSSMNRIDKGMSTGLALFSLGLGAVELLAPRWLARTIGLDISPALMRTFGLREIASGIGMLAQPRSPTWPRARVAGDAMDLALLATAGKSGGASGTGRAVAIAAVVGVAALDLYASQRSARQRRPRVLDNSIIVARSPGECYGFWRDLTNLPQFLRYAHEESEITDDVPDQSIDWRSLPGAEVVKSGSVRFDPAAKRGSTQIRVIMRYEPGQRAGTSAPWLLGGDPARRLRQDLQRLRDALEAQEGSETAEAQPAAEVPDQPQPTTH